MNKRVFNALRKIAAEEPTTDQRNQKDLHSWENGEYKDALFNATIGRKYDPWSTGVVEFGDKPLARTRLLQAQRNAAALFPFGTNEYFNFVKHLKNYGETKHHNFYNPENPKPMPVFDAKGMSEKQVKTLREMEHGQASNRRSNPYSDIG